MCLCLWLHDMFMGIACQTAYTNEHIQVTELQQQGEED